MTLYNYLSSVVGIAQSRKLHPSTRRRVTAFGLAIHIPVAVWALTGFVTASQIFEQTILVSVSCGLACSILIYFVERLVLETPTSWVINFIRFCLGIVVAVLGATTVDLALFDREISQQLKSTGEAGIKIDFDKRINEAEETVLERKRDWLEAQKLAECEANGTCGSRRASVGPVYRELSRQANTLRDDYLATIKDLESLRASRQKTLAEWASSDIAIRQAGLLARIKALKDYIHGDPVALGAWGIFFFLMVALELMVVFAKWAFGSTVDDEIERIREKLSEQRAKSYYDSVTSPGYLVDRLIDSPASTM